MKLNNLTDAEIWEYLYRGLIEDLPKDVALDLLDYAYEQGYDAGYEDAECESQG